VSVHGPDGHDVRTHGLLGAALSVLQDQPAMPSDGVQQGESIRARLVSVDLDSLTKLWSAFQTALRASFVLHVGPIVIETVRPQVVVKPVLTPEVSVEASLSPPFPTMSSVEFPSPGAPATATIAVAGWFPPRVVIRRVTFVNERLGLTVHRGPASGEVERISSDALKVAVGDPTDFTPGWWRVSVTYQRSPAQAGVAAEDAVAGDVSMLVREPIAGFPP
jgi:hypothetical protein